MPRKLPPASGPASLETIAEHCRVGRRWIRNAEAAHPGLLPEDALAAVQSEGGPLDASTVGRYRADLKYGLLETMTASRRLADFPAAWAKVNAALTRRKARIAKKDKRTSAKKIKDATDAEARALFGELKRHALNHENPNAILAALFVLVAGHAGFRPIELRGAQLAGTLLTLPNSKRRPGHEPGRIMDLAGLHDDVLVGIGLMLELIDHDLDKRAFAAWQKVLAGQLQRACERIGIRTLSLYSFRHVAIASWAAAGLSPQEIAQLCGHLSISTAHTHYARAAKGHKRKAVARAVPAVSPEPARETSQVADARQERPTPKAQAEKRSELVDHSSFGGMPEPVYRQDHLVTTVPAAEARRHFDSLVDPRDPAEIARNIRKAREAREAREAARDLKRTDEAEPRG